MDTKEKIKLDRQPLTSADFPPGTIVREKDIPTTWHLVTTVTNNGIYITVHMHPLTSLIILTC